MNPTSDPPPHPPPQPPLQQQAHRASFSCERHPQENFTGFCPICLCERLATLDPNTTTPPPSSSSRKPPLSSTAAAALKAIFKPSVSAARSNNRPPTSSSSSSFFPELRRTKSFSASKNEGFSGVFEPQRKSCDVRVRSTLSNLFHQDGDRFPFKKEASRIPSGDAEAETTKNLLPSSSTVIESKEEEEEEEIKKEENIEDEEEEEGEIRVLEEPNLGDVIEDRVQEIVEEEEGEEQEEEDEFKTMKDHIDLDSQAKKASGGRHLKEIAGTFWSAASVFSKKLQKWRHKQKKMKKHGGNGGAGGGGGGGSSATLPVEKPIGRQFRETQSEIADYGFGRRSSCDTDPRFSLDIGRMSLDAGRMSFDDPRYSFDEPRASWDGYLIGKTAPRMMPPPMLSVVEDAPVVQVIRSDTQIPVVEEPPVNVIINEDQAIPGGTMQTREYYSDSSSRRRKSLDRSNSARKIAAAVVAEMDELKSSAPNAKVTPAAAAPAMVVPDRILRDSNSNSLRDDCLDQTFELGFGDTASVIGGGGDQKGAGKKSRRWSKGWNIWGLINRRGGNKEEEEDRYSRTNGTERSSFSESWHDLGSERIRDSTRNGFNPKVMRSNSSVSWRNGQGMNGSFGGSMRKNGFHGSKGRDNNNRDEFVLERNRSARYSTSDADNNGLWRFYLTPMRVGGGWRNVGSSGKARSNQAQSIARSVLRLY